MSEFVPFDPRWFKELKKNREDFYEVNNMIESAKFKFDREFNTPKWLVGHSNSDPAFNRNLELSSILKFIALWGFVVSFAELFIVLLVILSIDNRQKIAMLYLYREKDNQDRDRARRGK
jgi:hypothetical protein